MLATCSVSVGKGLNKIYLTDGMPTFRSFEETESVQAVRVLTAAIYDLSARVPLRNDITTLYFLLLIRLEVVTHPQK